MREDQDQPQTPATHFDRSASIAVHLVIQGCCNRSSGVYLSVGSLSRLSPPSSASDEQGGRVGGTDQMVTKCWKPLLHLCPDDSSAAKEGIWKVRMAWTSSKVCRADPSGAAMGCRPRASSSRLRPSDQTSDRMLYSFPVMRSGCPHAG